MSDHYYVDLSFKEILRNQDQFGPGYWKCNTSVLSDPALYKDIENLYYTKFRPTFIKDGEWWEESKQAFRKTIISHCRRKSNDIKREILRLEKALRDFTLFANSDSSFFTQYVLQIKQQLNDLIIQKFNGSVFRSRVQFIEQYEKPNRFFLRTERQHVKNRTITEIRTDTEFLTDPQSIINTCRQYYSELYTEEPVSRPAINYFLHNVNLPRVPPDLAIQCDGD